MTAIIDNIKLRKVVNKVLSAPERDIIEKITDQDVYQNSSGYFTILNECIYNDTETNFKGLFTDEACSTPYPSDAYTLNVTSAVIQFTSHPPTLWAKYLPGGSIIWAEDINHLTDAVKAIDDNAFYKDGSIMMTGNLNMDGRNIINSGTINNINLSTHQHLGQEIDGTTQLTEDSISDLSMSKITGLQDAFDSKQNKLPTYQSGKFLTNNGSVLSWGLPYTRNIGEIIQSILPLNDTKLHLLDGGTLSGVGTYNELYNYLLNNSTVTQYVSGVGIIGSLQNLNNVLSGFSASNYAQIPLTFGSVNQENWEIQIKFKFKEITSYISPTLYQDLISPELQTSAFKIYFYSHGASGGTSFVINITYTNSNGVQENFERPIGTRLIDNQDYWLRYGYENSTFYVKTSEDGVNFTRSYIIESQHIQNVTFPIYEKSFLNLGIHTGVNPISPWLGSIDLNECYIDCNGVRLWQGGITYNKPESDFIIDEGIWESIYAKYNSCGNFVLDTLNQTIRLPYIRGIIQGTVNTSHVGLITPAGLPNITGSPILGENNSSWSKMPPIEGAIYRASTKANKYAGASDGDNDYLAFDASRSNPIYGRSNTVQPQTIKVLNYMVVSK